MHFNEGLVFLMLAGLANLPPVCFREITDKRVTVGTSRL